MFEGVLMVQKEFEKVFGKLGLKRIYPECGKFDPNFHQAVSQVEVEGFEAGAVVQVVGAGFELNGRVLKPAMVVVAK
jgi:molecular chaperone GrpE